MANYSGKQLHLKGHGDGLHVDIEPSTNFSLGPVLPGTENCVQELFLVNPTEYTIEAPDARKRTTLRITMCSVVRRIL